MHDMAKDFSCTQQYITVHISELSLEHETIQLKLGELEVLKTKISLKTFEKANLDLLRKCAYKTCQIFGAQSCT